MSFRNGISRIRRRPAGRFAYTPAPVNAFVQLRAPDGVIAAEDARNAAASAGLDEIDLLSALVRVAARYARPPVSGFRVGAIARGTSGALYYGANVEIPGEALSFTVHAEQSAVVNAWTHGESGIDLIATSAAPCGYCRQFLNELTTAGRLQVAFDGASKPLAHYLPDAFGPHDLRSGLQLMKKCDHRLTTDSGDDELARAALEAANRSYAPYSRSYAAVALRGESGRIFAGPYAENAAFNPSMAPLLGALSLMNLAGEDFASIADVVLVHVDDMHTDSTRFVLRKVTSASLRTVRARNSDRRGRR